MNVKKYLLNGILSVCVASALFGAVPGVAGAEEAAAGGELVPQTQQEPVVFTY